MPIPRFALCRQLLAGAFLISCLAYSTFLLAQAPTTQPPAKKAEAPAPPQQQPAAAQQAPAAQAQRAPSAAGQEGGPVRSAQGEEERGGPMSARTFNGLRLRSIGPAVTSGRIAALAVNPQDSTNIFVAAASGGVWKTTNAGITWTPVFENEGSYSIGAITLDPKNPSIVWVGTGENNSQRSVGYGDGVYRSEDGGRTWRNMGLKNSEHIGKIIVDPRDSNVVYVAAQGPLWGPGGDRGLYKTTDGGKTWKAVLTISENTGVTDIAMDPQNPDTIYAAAWQRRRHVWTLINGGPESGLHKSVDGGATWTKLRGGLPGGPGGAPGAGGPGGGGGGEDIGRIGLAISPADPRVIYAQIEAGNRRGGTYRSADRGATWERRNEYDTTAMYYGKIFADPKDADRIYVMNVNIMTSDEGGRNLRSLGSRSKHVDNHAMWIDPANTDHMLVGCDGGLYESYDRGANWRFFSNLPITQFYAVTVDTAAPFYNVYGGTQDNFSLGGPARSRNNSINNYDWFVTQGGDGFRSVVDPEDPNIVYAESQHGGLVRFDRRTGERLGIQPQEGKGEMGLRWNWDSPILISPHAHTRLYFAANKLFRSDDRGDTWKAVSGELSREIDRNKLPVMGKVWGPDAIAKSASTSLYGNCTALTESAKKEGVIYVGTDDGLIHVTEDGGKTWRKIEKFSGVPDNTFVSRLLASQHDVNTVFAAFDNHKNSDFAPYLLKSTDSGKTWTSIKGDLPANGPVYAIAEDHINANLLFVGTEFGLFFSTNGGQKWIRLRGGFPTIAVKDLAIHKQMNDLAVATFGRGFYILDDYSPLRAVKMETFAAESSIFPVRDALMFIPASPIGGRGKGFQGETYFTAENPPVGATITYFLKEAPKTKKQRRQDAEREAGRKNEALRYPSADELRAEDEEEAPALILTVTDSTGRVVRRLNGSATPGLQRVTWDLREPAANLPPERGAGGPGGGGGGAGGGGEEGFFEPPGGPLVMPGTYKVTLAKRVDGALTPLPGEQTFNVVVEGQASMKPEDRAALHAFQQKVVKLQRAVNGALDVANTTKTRLGLIKRAIQETPSLDLKVREQADTLDKRVNEILRALRGDTSLRQRNENTPPAISERVGGIAGDQRQSISRPTQTHLDAYAIAAQEFAVQLAALRLLVETDLTKLEKTLEAAGAPYTPGRIPTWQDQ
ncbi:MAG TPA: hypothetical protein VGQ11_02325 [Candidatus Acidoferrales bacterium]|nr:hypothetical protein [Candidatus Acidoferrales bacterium]